MIKLRSIGQCLIEIGNSRLGPDAELIFALLTYLIVERGRPIPRTELTALFWADQTDGKARHCLRQAIYKLRRLGAPIETSFNGYFLAAQCASTDFESEECIDAILEASTLRVSTSVLPGFSPNASPPYTAWLDEQRGRAESHIRRYLITRLAEARRRNSWDESVSLARQCLALDPLNEEATLTLAEATALSGNKRAAVRMLDEYVADVGKEHTDIRLPASLLRNRIAERVTYIPAALAPHSTFVGRADSLRLLQALAREVSAGAGHTCLVEGEPGIGKSRLATEFANIAAMSGYRIVRTACRADAGEQALSVFMALAPQLLRLPGALGCSPEALSLVRRLNEHDTARDLPSYGDPRTLHTALRHAIRDLTDALASERPLILLVEDVHWADDHSWSVLRELSASNRTRPLLLLLTSRSAVARLPDEAWDTRQVVLHHLTHLDHEHSIKLAGHVCTSLGLERTDALISWCVKHATGNPLFITELLCHWRETRDMSSVPPSLDAMIRQRLQTLSPEALRTLQTVGLLGNLATHENVEAVLDLPRWQLMGALDELDRAHLAASTAHGVRVTHDLSSLAAIQAITPLSGALLHASIASVCEHIGTASHDASLLWRGATHWSAAGDKERALRLVITCAQHLLSIGLAIEAASLLDRARIFCSSTQSLRHLLGLRVGALLRASALTDVLVACEEVLQLDAHESSIHSDEELAMLRALVGLHSGDGAAMTRALTCVRAADASLTHRLEAAVWGLAACYASRRVDVADELVHLLGGLEPQSAEDQRYLLSARLIYYADRGDYANGISTGDQLIALERQEGNLQSLARALRVSAYAHRHAGNWAIVEARLTESAIVSKQLNHIVYYAHAIIAEAQYRIDRRQLEHAGQLVRTLDHLSSEHPYLAIPLVDTVSAEVAILRGDANDAHRFLTRVRQLDSSATRHECDRVTLVLSYQLLRGDRVSCSAVEELRRLHFALRDSPGHDYSASTLFAAMRQLSRSFEADQLAADYLRLRKERWKPWLTFQSEC
jgi:DNA-binding SARP family transcriptional activator